MPYLFLLVCIVAVDQAVKILIENEFALHESVPVIEGFFHLTYVQNTGAAFSIMEGKQILFILLASVISSILIIYIIKNRKKQSGFLLLGLALIAAGGIGNLIDRIRLGYVVDFLDLRIWPVFNVADIAVTTGCVLLVWYTFFIEAKKNKKII
ncbi:MAG: signal peptidase II [Eubacteriales bacterium]|nr:signal peptidase II [Eubacteriales bacterium]MDD3349897.1 signal peptidase II [Eubacteriales bacterium]